MSETRTVGPKSARKAIEIALKVRRPIFAWGSPGIGKSDMIKQIGADTESAVIDVRLSLWDPTDIKGIPYYDDDSKSMKWAPPEELPSLFFADNHKRVILLLDELNSAPPSVQAAAYQLVLDRKVGAYILPENVVIVAAGNKESDRGVTYKMPAPLANRFIHIEIEPSFDDWFEWATKSNIHKDILSFLSWSKADLFNFDPKSSSRSFATPRSWSFVNDFLHHGECDSDTLMTLVSGAIGETAIKFRAHRELITKMPNPMDILSGKIKKLDNIELSAKYSLIIGLCYEMKDAATKQDPKFNNYVDKYFTFCMTEFEPELVILGLKMILITYKLPINMGEIKDIEAFNDKFGKYISLAIQ